MATEEAKLQWRNSELTQALLGTLQSAREELKEAWAQGRFGPSFDAEKEAIGAIRNIDSTIDAIRELTSEAVKNDEGTGEVES